MSFSDALINWYQNNKRDLPWRNTIDAYTIWLSEIILQQTRVEQGMPYFYRFLDRHPTVKDFAAASEDEILNLWQGLGYYSRGRNMLVTARQVTAEYGGAFPTSYAELIKLKGIGEYTAAAIASFSANEAKAVVDGNVYRVLARYFAIDEPINSTKGKKLFQTVADEMLSTGHPALHNQAMMELGAIICKPKKPACGICPVKEGCQAFLTNGINFYPVKLKKVKVRERFLTYFLITDGNTILLNKRGGADIWANMYDLPMVETSTLSSPYEILNRADVNAKFGADVVIRQVFPVCKHVLTHQKLQVQFVQIDAPGIKLEQEWFFTEVENLKNFAMPQIIFIFLNKIFK